MTIRAMTAGLTPMLHILNHCCTTATKFDIAYQQGQQSCMMKPKCQNHTQYKKKINNTKQLVSKTERAVHKVLGDLLSSPQQQQFRRSPSILSPYCQSQLRRGCSALWSGDHQVTMLHCTPCDDDPGKDSTLLIASVLHEQTCITISV